MTAKLEREGIFKMRPLSWKVEPSQNSKSVAIAIEFVVLAQLAEDVDANGAKVYSWIDWSEAEEHRVWGRYYVVGKEGKANVSSCEQLAESMGWNGTLKSVQAGPPPRGLVVQVTVKADTYNGKTTYKAGWMNPGDYVPTGGGADESEVNALDAQFGSLLRAAASSKLKPKKAAPAAPADPNGIPF